ncbi:MAG: ATP-dependent Clp protease ATP-binding subunit [Clostridiales bacterium]|nr:ATP-dependent Clp protease ATP-binding subunit [Clostridiales bacterium]
MTYSASFRVLVAQARDLATGELMDLHHLVYALLQDSQAPWVAALESAGFPLERAKEMALARMGSIPSAEPGMTDELKRFLTEDIFAPLFVRGGEEVNPGHIILAFLEVPRLSHHWFAGLLKSTGLTGSRFLASVRGAGEEAETSQEAATPSKSSLASPPSGSSTSTPSPKPSTSNPSPTPSSSSSSSSKPLQEAWQRIAAQPLHLTGILAQIGSDLTAKAAEGKLSPALGREKEIAAMIRILARRENSSPLLVGEPGVGKTAIVEGLALRLVQGRVPQTLQGYRILSLDLNALVAGTIWRGQLEERIRQLLHQLRSLKRTICFIDEIHTLIQANQSSDVSLADNLKPFLARGEIRIIGATTPQELREYLEKDQALLRRFQEVKVEPPSPEATLRILEEAKARYERYHGVYFPPETLQAAVTLAARYLPTRHFPAKAFDILDEAAAKKKMEETHHATVRPEDLAEVLAERLRIPIDLGSKDERKRLLQLETLLKERVRGQDEALRALAQALKRARAGLKEPHKPIGSFFFMGPTGVGKTETAKALAEAYFQDPQALNVFNMAEYADDHDLWRLMGSARGYKESELGGTLTEAVRRKPFSVLLFDEIEKAHPKIYDIFLSILDEGRAEDGTGRIADFQHTIIIFTSNVSGSLPPDADLQNPEEYRKYAEESKVRLREHFRPEFINRLDAVILFRPLGRNELKVIAHLQLKKLQQKLAEKRMKVTFDDHLATWLLDQLEDLSFGARPLRRILQDQLETPLAEELFKHDLQPGTRIHIQLEKGQPVFRFRHPQGVVDPS